ncbi:relaxin-3 [Austrofundulus limnaeus]|uniref:Insulin-like 3 n=1 Tax=Austrofundulus limnaeus TaxID=52670 RepID=A0A2I4C738_AUSLI|nr:PREDICTED: relaxin-3-like [Austrofundulus limnaeus]
MCGRELIRLAVSTCGNSRLRRSILDTELGEDHHTSDWGKDSSTEQDQPSETPLQSDEDKVVSLAPQWDPPMSLVRRAAGKISDICCEKGCSMKELIQFC